jgi:hypothetical protein
VHEEALLALQVTEAESAWWLTESDQGSERSRRHRLVVVRVDRDRDEVCLVHWETRARPLSNAGHRGQDRGGGMRHALIDRGRVETNPSGFSFKLGDGRVDLLRKDAAEEEEALTHGESLFTLSAGPPMASMTERGRREGCAKSAPGGV